jgi:hypothetical protein
MRRSARIFEGHAVRSARAVRKPQRKHADSSLRRGLPSFQEGEMSAAAARFFCATYVSLRPFPLDSRA